MPRILIVEDEDIIRSAVRKLLQHAGYEVADAVSVEEAEGLDPDGYDLVTTDLRLRGAAGTEMSNCAHNTPVLINTSYGRLRPPVDSVKQCAADYIDKPFDDH